MPREMKQIADFVMETEQALSNFGLDAMAMRGRLPALRNTITELAQVARETPDEELQARLNDLEIKAENCRDCIERRLLINSWSAHK